MSTAQAMYDMSKDWYAGRLGEDWQPRTREEAEAIFAKHRLVGDFWALG